MMSDYDNDYPPSAGYCDYCDYNHSQQYLRVVEDMLMCPYHFQEWLRDPHSFCVSPVEYRCQDCWIKIFGHYVWRLIENAEIDQHICDRSEHCDSCKKQSQEGGGN